MRCFVQTSQSPENRNPETQNIKKMKLRKSLQKTTKPAFQIETQGKKIQNATRKKKRKDKMSVLSPHNNNSKCKQIAFIYQRSGQVKTEIQINGTNQKAQR